MDISEEDERWFVSESDVDISEEDKRWFVSESDVDISEEDKRWFTSESDVVIRTTGKSRSLILVAVFLSANYMAVACFSVFRCFFVTDKPL